VSGTKITLLIADPEVEGKSWQIELADDFETVLNKCFPINTPSSNLEHRQNMSHTMSDGRRIALQPSSIFCMEEIESNE